ncbi:hypothetical protein AAFC00_002338 [Neodothiora populina]|uniref:HTH APSES-type domain-containing protein n=1 Tax=Neodothiora populina TaxID=2781224 RepID=A0ABR3PH38_9PEZI
MADLRTKAVYSGVQVYEMEVNGVACMRRRSDGWLNATQILKVAGIDKGKRTKVLEKEILTGDHEKVQGGYGKYQGTWISYHRGREFCRQYGVEEPLLPLLEYDLNGDGTGVGTQNTETPTKEQAMAANRKRFYNTGSALDNRSANQSTFFQNISPMSQIALTAMNKVARLNSPARPNSSLRPSSMQPAHPGHGLQSSDSFSHADSGYGTTQNQGGWRQSGQEPPRKRMRQSEGPAMDVDTSMMSMDPTEPSDSFGYSQSFVDSSMERDEFATDPALPAPASAEDEEKKASLLDLFADTQRTDYTTHPAFTQLSPQDLSIPLDASANTALHWATTLSRINLLRMLIQKGANIYRGNVAGHSALISAVLVNNCWERSSFPDVLELLSPLIEIRDHQGRTILHHIAVSCGIKGRAPSSKYYLEALLEFLVRSAKPSGADRIARANSESQERPKQTTLLTFLANIVNAKDKLGNTALNLVARIGNRSIIQQLLEIKADPNIPNFKGVSARDFGVGVEDVESGFMPARNHLLNGTSSTAVTYNNPNNIDPAISQSPSNGVARTDGGVTDEVTAQQDSAAAQAAITEDQNQDVISSLTTMLTQNLAQHKALLAAKTAQIDRLNTEIRELSSAQKSEADALGVLQQRSKTRSDRLAKIANLRRLVEERSSQRQRPSSSSSSSSPTKKLSVGEAEQRIPSLASIMATARDLPSLSEDNSTATDVAYLHTHHLDLYAYLSSLSPSDLRLITRTYTQNNSALSSVSMALQKRSAALEQQYRKVVALCTSVPEERVEESLPLLVAAVESERGGLGFGREEVGRVRDFLVKVEGVGGGGGGNASSTNNNNGGKGGSPSPDETGTLNGRAKGTNGGADMDMENTTPRMMGSGGYAGHAGMQRGAGGAGRRMGPPELPV